MIEILKKRVGGLPVVHLNRQLFAGLLLQDWNKQKQSDCTLRPKTSFSANGQIVAEVNGNTAMMSIFNRADYIDADGMWLVFASKLISKTPLQERVATTDFFHDTARVCEANGLSIFMLGSTPENNQKACEKIKKIYPAIVIAGAHHGYFGKEQEPVVLAQIKMAKPDVLWVAMGYPRQEIFVDKYVDLLSGVTWIKTCGGLLEHILELHPRAPIWIQKIGFEWLYRLLQEPRRLTGRYLRTNPLAAWYLLTKTDRF